MYNLTSQLNVTGRIIIIGFQAHLLMWTDAIILVISTSFLPLNLLDVGFASECNFGGLLGSGLGDATQAGFRQ